MTVTDRHRYHSNHSMATERSFVMRMAHKSRLSRSIVIIHCVLLLLGALLIQIQAKGQSGLSGASLEIPPVGGGGGGDGIGAGVGTPSPADIKGAVKLSPQHGRAFYSRHPLVSGHSQLVDFGRDDTEETLITAESALAGRHATYTLPISSSTSSSPIVPIRPTSSTNLVHRPVQYYYKVPSPPPPSNTTIKEALRKEPSQEFHQRTPEWRPQDDEMNTSATRKNENYDYRMPATTGRNRSRGSSYRSSTSKSSRRPLSSNSYGHSQEETPSVPFYEMDLYMESSNNGANASEASRRRPPPAVSPATTFYTLPAITYFDPFVSLPEFSALHAIEFGPSAGLNLIPQTGTPTLSLLAPQSLGTGPVPAYASPPTPLSLPLPPSTVPVLAMMPNGQLIMTSDVLIPPAAAAAAAHSSPMLIPSSAMQVNYPLGLSGPHPHYHHPQGRNQFQGSASTAYPNLFQLLRNGITGLSSRFMGASTGQGTRTMTYQSTGGNEGGRQGGRPAETATAYLIPGPGGSVQIAMPTHFHHPRPPLQFRPTNSLSNGDLHPQESNNFVDLYHHHHVHGHNYDHAEGEETMEDHRHYHHPRAHVFHPYSSLHTAAAATATYGNNPPTWFP